MLRYPQFHDFLALRRRRQPFGSASDGSFDHMARPLLQGLNEPPSKPDRGPLRSSTLRGVFGARKILWMPGRVRWRQRPNHLREGSKATSYRDCRSLSPVAPTLGVSSRTLARRLAAERLSFGEILNQLRSDLATHHLGDAKSFDL